MIFRVREIHSVNRSCPPIAGRWYLVEPKNNLLRWFWSNLLFQHKPHRDKKEAIAEAKLRNEGKYVKEGDKTISIIEVNKNGI